MAYHGDQVSNGYVTKIWGSADMCADGVIAPRRSRNQKVHRIFELGGAAEDRSDAR